MSREPQERADGPVLDFTDDAATLGDRLTLSREAAGLDLGQLAERIGVRPQTVRNWEEDRAEPRSNRLQMLAGMLDVSLVWLISGLGPGPRAASGPGPAEPAALACLADLRRLRAEQAAPRRAARDAGAPAAGAAGLSETAEVRLRRLRMRSARRGTREMDLILAGFARGLEALPPVARRIRVDLVGKRSRHSIIG